MHKVIVPQPAICPWSWRQLARNALAAILPRRRLLVRGPANSGAVCLTFDDGPHPEHTPALLDALREHGTPATFFVIGRQAERYPELVRRMAAEGHVVGHHSFTHSDPRRTPARQLLEEVHQTRDVLTKLLGGPPRLFRPPHGKLTTAKLWGLWRAGQTVVLWSVDPNDFACTSADQVRARLQSCPLRGGAIILMHDNHPHAAQVLPSLVAATRERGLRFATIAEWSR